MQNIQEQGVRDEDLVLLLEDVPGNEWMENYARPMVERLRILSKRCWSQDWNLFLWKAVENSED